MAKKPRFIPASFITAALIFSAPGFAKTFVYVSNADSGTLSRYSLDENSGKLTLLGNTDAAPKVMPMAVSPDQKHLYTAVRSRPWSVITWDIDGESGNLVKKASADVPASYPYISTDKTGKYLLGASYDSDIVTSNLINSEGVVTEKVTGTYKTGPHAHSVIADNTNKHLYIGNLGADHVVQLNFSSRGKMTPIGKGYVETEPGSGPRHSVITPDNRYLYNIAEMGGTITQYAIDPHTGALRRVTVWPNAVAEKYHLQYGRQRPAGYNDPTPRIWSADIKMTPDGQYLYVSERTTNTVTGYRVAPKTGALTLIDTWQAEQQPRGIAVDKTGKWLIATGEKSTKVGSYAIDRQTGALRLVSEADCGKDANWAVIVTL